MVEKIGHIKNPLTVIAIFAALAEVSGAVVLPFLDKDTQHMYVWFLMAFPILLVMVFFLVLYMKHHVLYAPTDFNDDKTFKELFENASSVAKVEKINSEQEEPAVDLSPTAEATAPVTDTSVTTISAADTLRRSFQGNGLLAEELVIAKLGKDFGLKFERNLSVKGQAKLVFDGVATTQNRAVVAEVRFTRQGMLPEQMITDYFERVSRFAETLPEELRGKIEFVFAIATDTDDEMRIRRIERTVEKIRSVSEGYSFRTAVRFFKMQDLEREFSVK